MIVGKFTCMLLCVCALVCSCMNAIDHQARSIELCCIGSCESVESPKPKALKVDKTDSQRKKKKELYSSFSLVLESSN